MTHCDGPGFVTDLSHNDDQLGDVFLKFICHNMNVPKALTTEVLKRHIFDNYALVRIVNDMVSKRLNPPRYLIRYMIHKNAITTKKEALSLLDRMLDNNMIPCRYLVEFCMHIKPE